VGGKIKIGIDVGVIILGSLFEADAALDDRV
jgi:hypothetical protein